MRWRLCSITLGHIPHTCPATLPPSQISSIEEADRKMAELAQQGKIDPAFLQITAKVGERRGAAGDSAGLHTPVCHPANSGESPHPCLLLTTTPACRPMVLPVTPT
jgi:hypothetical protein